MHVAEPETFARCQRQRADRTGMLQRDMERRDEAAGLRAVARQLLVGNGEHGHARPYPRLERRRQHAHLSEHPLEVMCPVTAEAGRPGQDGDGAGRLPALEHLAAAQLESGLGVGPLRAVASGQTGHLHRQDDMAPARIAPAERGLVDDLGRRRPVHENGRARSVLCERRRSDGDHR